MSLLYLLAVVIAVLGLLMVLNLIGGGLVLGIILLVVGLVVAVRPGLR